MDPSSLGPTHRSPKLVARIVGEVSRETAVFCSKMAADIRCQAKLNNPFFDSRLIQAAFFFTVCAELIRYHHPFDSHALAESKTRSRDLFNGVIEKA